jgi:hypothetical protein
MKKMSFIILSLVLFSACENHSNDDFGNVSVFGSCEIGKIHNEVLAYYHSKGANVFSTEEIVLLIEEYLIYEKKYDKETVRECSQQMMSTPEYGLMFNSKSTFDQSSIFAYLDATKKHFNPSDKLMDTFRQAFILGEDSDAAEVKDFIINNIKNKSWSGTDKDLAYVFTDVFLHSYDYWTKTSGKKLKKSTLLILYDTGGALHGLIFGPVVSIIEGALVSAALSEKLPD